MKSLHIIIRNLTFFVLFHILINEENNIIKYVKCKQQKRMTSRQKLFHAISSANYKEVRKLVKNDLIDVNSKNDYEETPLHISALSNKQANFINKYQLSIGDLFLSTDDKIKKILLKLDKVESENFNQELDVFLSAVREKINCIDGSNFELFNWP